MRGSLQRRLTLTLALAIIVAGLIAASASFVFGYFEAQELQDDTLRQIAAGEPNTDCSVSRDTLVSKISDDDHCYLMRCLIAKERACIHEWIPGRE